MEYPGQYHRLILEPGKNNSFHRSANIQENNPKGDSRIAETQKNYIPVTAEQSGTVSCVLLA